MTTEEHFWLTIDAIADCYSTKHFGDKAKDAILRLYCELDRRMVCNEPLDNIKRLISTLERLKYEINE